MKLIQFADGRFLLDLGSEATPDMVDQVSAHWNAWWNEHPGEIPKAFVVGGSEVPVEYEDRREPDIESRLRALENHFHSLGLDRSGLPRNDRD